MIDTSDIQTGRTGTFLIVIPGMKEEGLMFVDYWQVNYCFEIHGIIDVDVMIQMPSFSFYITLVCCSKRGLQE